jgi:peroxiredoxin
MTTKLQAGDRFPDFELPNQQNELIQISQLSQPSLLDHRLGFLDGYPLILVFYRGFFCPRDSPQCSKTMMVCPPQGWIPGILSRMR